MIIAFPVEDNEGLRSRISEDFASAPFFYWHDTDSGDSGCDDNDSADGRKTAQSVADTGAEAVVVSEIGCAAVNRLRGLGVTAYAAKSPDIEENIRFFLSGELSRINAGECDGSCR